MRHLVPYVHQFESHPLTTISYDGRPVWPGRMIGRVLGYANDGKRLPTLVTGDWKDEFILGVDYAVATGSELKRLQAAAPKGPDYGPYESRRGLLLLFEPGLHLALIKTRKPVGRKLRRFIAEEVLPQIARDGRYLPERSATHTEAISPSADVIGQREHRLAERLAFEDRRFKASSLRRAVHTLHELGQVGDDLLGAYEVAAAEIALGQDLSHLKPTIEPDWLSPSQIADRFKVTANRVGRVISKLDLRGKEGLSRSIVNKARGHNKTVQSWLYSPQAVQLIEEELVASGVVPEAN